MNCLRCNTPSGEHSHHTTFIGNREVFPLCQQCWSALSPEERLPYYERLVRRWMKDYPVISLAELEKFSQEWEAIKKAVLEGK